MQENNLKKPTRELSNCRTLILKNNIKNFKAAIHKGIIYKEKGLHKSNQDTLLHFAVSIGKIEFAKLLLNNGANVNAVDSNNKLPIQHAIDKVRFEMVELLVRNGSLIKLYHLKQNERGKLLEQIEHFKAQNINSKLFSELSQSFNIQAKYDIENKYNNIVDQFAIKDNSEKSVKISEYLFKVATQKLKILDALHTKDKLLICNSIEAYKELFSQTKLVMPNFLNVCVRLKVGVVTNLLVENGCDPYQITTTPYKTK